MHCISFSRKAQLRRFPMKFQFSPPWAGFPFGSPWRVSLILAGPDSGKGPVSGHDSMLKAKSLQLSSPPLGGSRLHTPGLTCPERVPAQFPHPQPEHQQPRPPVLGAHRPAEGCPGQGGASLAPAPPPLAPRVASHSSV